MNRILSILLALLVLVSGIHLSVAAHVCGGEVAAVKWSVSGETASCGMECDKLIDNALPQKSVQSACCHNIFSFFSVDHNYQNVTGQVLTLFQSVVSLFFVENQIFNFCHLVHFFNITSYPPGVALLTDVSLPEICVFRI